MIWGVVPTFKVQHCIAGAWKYLEGWVLRRLDSTYPQACLLQGHISL